MPAWRAHGLAAITVNPQGGSPLGYYREDALRSRLHEAGIEERDDVIWAGSLTPPPLEDVQTTLVPPGGATVVEMKLEYPGRSWHSCCLA